MSLLLKKLASEIITEIIDTLHPSSHLPFALTCKYIYGHSRQALSRHRDAHIQYATASDMHPSTVQTLVRSIIGFEDPIIAWHVRSIEIWGSRGSWEDWRPFNLELGKKGLAKTPVFVPEIAPLSWEISKEEMKRCLRMGPVPPEKVDDARAELQHGRDGFMKLLLFGYCERLNDIKFVRRQMTEASGIHCDWLTSGITWSLEHGSWPPGFQTLRTLSIGVASGTYLDHATRFYAPENFLEAIFSLPEIEDLYLSTLWLYAGMLDFALDGDFGDHFRPRSSSVKRIYLDDVGTNRFYRQAFGVAPRALESFTVRGSSTGHHEDFLEDMILEVADHQSSTLETLQLYRIFSLQSGDCGVYRLRKFCMSNFEKLQHLCIVIQDLENNPMQIVNHEAGGKQLSYETLRERFSSSLLNVFPPTIEILHIQCSDGSPWFTEDEAEEIYWSDEAVVRLIESESLPHLRAIVVEKSSLLDLDDLDGDENLSDEDVDELYFERAIEAGRHRGINVHVMPPSWNSTPKKHSINFPAAPGKFDLVSGPHWGKRGEDWEVIPSRGDWEPPGGWELNLP